MFGWRILLWAVLVLAVLLFLYLVRGILPPFIIAFIIASLLEPSIRKLRLRGLKRQWAVMFVFALFFGSVATIGVIVGPRIGSQVTDLQSTVTEIAQNLQESQEQDNFFIRWNPVIAAQHQRKPSRIDELLAPHRATLDRLSLPSTQAGIMRNYIEPSRGRIADLLKAGASSFLGSLAALPAHLLHIILIPILAYMMLMDMEDFKRRAPKYIPPALRASTMRLFEDIGDVFMRYLRGVATVTLLYLLCSTLLFLIFQVPYAILVAIIFSALYLIPYIGNVIAYVILFFLVGLSGTTGLNMASPWAYSAVVTGAFIAMAFTFDHLIYPSMVGSSVGLNGVVSLFVILCGGALFGLPGMLLAYPLAGSIKVILDRLLRVTSTSAEELNLPTVPLRHKAIPAG